MMENCLSLNTAERRKYVVGISIYFRISWLIITLYNSYLMGLLFNMPSLLIFHALFIFPIFIIRLLIKNEATKWLHLCLS